jgi:RNA polymerase sigma-70 factor, ECF subfamily
MHGPFYLHPPYNLAKLGYYLSKKFMPEHADEAETTELLRRMSDGDAGAADLLYPRLYRELRRLAASHLSRERPDHTLQPTALLNEAFLNLVKIKEPDWSSKAHFFSLAAKTMRRILIDHARGRQSYKRGGKLKRVDLDGVFEPARDAEPLLIALDEALNRLEAESPRAYRLVELKFFAGLSFDEAALALNVSSRTLKRDWDLAKRWLYRELRGDQRIVEA